MGIRRWNGQRMSQNRGENKYLASVVKNKGVNRHYFRKDIVDYAFLRKRR